MKNNVHAVSLFSMKIKYGKKTACDKDLLTEGE